MGRFRRTRALLLLLALIAGVVAPCQPFADPVAVAATGSGGLAFVSHRDGDGEIFTVGGNGRGRRQLTFSDRVYDGNPNWSPDGKRIVFARDPYLQLGGTGLRIDTSPRSARATRGRPGIFTMRPGGSDKTRLTKSGYDPAWSPDGQWIAFTGRFLGNYDIFLMRPDGTGLTQLTDDDEHDEYPTWSPDGTRIAFVRSTLREIDTGLRIPFPELVVLIVDGSGKQAIASDLIALLPDWSPDGTRLAVVAYDRSPFQDSAVSDIFTMRPDGSERINLTGDVDTLVRDPSWSPNGQLIAYAGETDVFVMDADGTGKRLLIRDAEDPDWRPAT